MAPQCLLEQRSVLPDILTPCTAQLQGLWCRVPSSIHAHPLDGLPTVPRTFKFQILSLSFLWGPFPGLRRLQEGQMLSFPEPQFPHV